MNRPLGLGRLALLVAFASLLAAPSGLAATSPEGEGPSWQLRQDLYAPVKEWVSKIEQSKNADGVQDKKATYSKTPTKIDDSTWEVTVHVNTAEENRQVTERYVLTLRKEAGEKRWSVADEKVADTYVGLYRETGVNCYPFETFAFDKEGLKLSATDGSVCESYMEGKVAGFDVHGAKMTYHYKPPEHAMRTATGHDFYAVHKVLSEEHAQALQFEPEAFLVGCDAETCEELLQSLFTDLERVPPEERGKASFEGESVSDWAQSLFDRTEKERHANAFAHFRPLDSPGHRYYSVFVSRELSPLDYGFLEIALPGSGVRLTRDNWAGWEVTFSVWPKRIDLPDALAGPVYGYYSEETLESSKPYDLERREDEQTRWLEVSSVKGTVDMGIDDPELLHGDIEFGLNLKKNVRELPFFISSFKEQGALGRDKPTPLSVNSIRMNGQELTWVSTGGSSGRVVLPEELPAGTAISLRMNYSTRAIVKYTHSYSYVSRSGWMPFVSFGDFIDDFDLTVRSPAKYDILGIGHKVSEEVQGDVLVSHWQADEPVVFPTVIFGKYRSDKPRFDAKKPDGTVIPVRVHVDEASFDQWQIPPKNLRPIAEQAANAINLYTELSGLDYPYGELNLVNDPLGFLYGQAPSSLIYLGSGVFRGEGFLATLPFFNNATAISKFLKSVVAHEVGHEWWGSRVSNANMRNYWFVESLAEYFSAVYLEGVYGWPEYEEQVEEWRRAILDTRIKQGVQNASSLYAGEDGFGSYQAAVYNKGPYAFHILRETFKGEGPRGLEGADKKFFQALKAMSQELARKREIVTLDIQNAAEKAFGGVDAEGHEYNVDLDWFFDQWLRGTGIPQFALEFSTRQTEDGSWIVQGRVSQRVVLGTSAKNETMDGVYYRGRTSVTVIGRDRKEYPYTLIVDGPQADFAFKVPVEPRDVVLNKNNEMLTLDPLVGRGF